ncbi:MFS transporter [Streptomyces hokutonensis]|uniref:MFS transporter n=1 Tax=Streptomyces hokutonensis TaxID=1306990 RepID=UPI0036C5C166
MWANHDRDSEGTFVFLLAVSWGVILRVMGGEMLPFRIRAAAMSVDAAFNWLANWAGTESLPRMADWNLSATYARMRRHACARRSAWLTVASLLVRRGRSPVVAPPPRGAPSVSGCRRRPGRSRRAARCRR